MYQGRNIKFDFKENQSDFYSKLEKELYWKGVHIIPFVPILREDYL